MHSYTHLNIKNEFSLSGVALLTPHPTMRSDPPSWTQSKTRRLTLRASPARALPPSSPGDTMESLSPVWARLAFWVRRCHYLSNASSQPAQILFINRNQIWATWVRIKTWDTGSLYQIQKDCYVLASSSPGGVGAPNFHFKAGIGGPEGNEKPREEIRMRGIKKITHFHLILSPEVLCLRKSDELNLTAALGQHCHHVDRWRVDTYTLILLHCKKRKKKGLIMGLNQMRLFRNALLQSFDACGLIIFYCYDCDSSVIEFLHV